MKRNKGYTLVELLVAVAVLILVMAEVGSLMVNSQKLYSNGYYEVNLQENAQQIISQVQDMLMDAAVKVDFDNYTYSSVASGDIISSVLTIETVERQYDGAGNPTGYNPVTIKVGRDVDLGITGAMKNDDGTHAGKEYSTLYIQKGSVNIPVAEGVRAMHIDMFHYAKSDMVTIELSMCNKQYGYEAKSEVYLRNQIGTGGPTMPISSVTSGADVDLTVLRIHTYKMRDYVPAGYNYFKFKDSEAATLSTQYNLSDTPDGWELTCSSLNTMWTATASGTILASRDGTYGSDTLEIRIHTDAVNDGNKMPLYVWSNETAECLSVLPVNGICTCDECAIDIVMDGEITVNAEGIEVNGHDVDLPLNRNSNSGNFNVKTHTADPPPEHDMGSGLPTMMTKAGVWDNEIFQRSRTDQIDLTNCVFEWQPRYLKDMYVGTSYEGLDPFSFVPGSTSQYVYELCYDKCTEYLKWPAESGNWGGKYTLKRIHTDVTNAFGLSTTTHTTDSQNYWDNIVGHGFGGNPGYVRVHLWCKFNHIPDSFIYDTYAYMYPQMTGSDSQHGELLDEMMIPEPVPADYGAYYDHTPTY